MTHFAFYVIPLYAHFVTGAGGLDNQALTRALNFVISMEVEMRNCRDSYRLFPSWWVLRPLYT